MLRSCVLDANCLKPLQHVLAGRHVSIGWLLGADCAVANQSRAAQRNRRKALRASFEGFHYFGSQVARPPHGRGVKVLNDLFASATAVPGGDPSVLGHSPAERPSQPMDKGARCTILVRSGHTAGGVVVATVTAAAALRRDAWPSPPRLNVQRMRAAIVALSRIVRLRIGNSGSEGVEERSQASRKPRSTPGCSTAGGLCAKERSRVPDTVKVIVAAATAKHALLMESNPPADGSPAARWMALRIRASCRSGQCW